jgi:hypothetical protein
MQTPSEFESSFKKEVEAGIGDTDAINIFWELHPELKEAMNTTAHLISGQNDEHVGSLEGRKWYGEHVLPVLVKNVKALQPSTDQSYVGEVGPDDPEPFEAL